MSAESSSDAPADHTLHTLVFNSLEQEIAVIDETGTIVDVNTAWINFGVEGGLPKDFPWRGRNYLAALADAGARGDDLAGRAAEGILDVVHDRRASFYFEYPCDGPQDKRWFMMRVSRLKDSGHRLVTISHQDITRRRLAEEQAEYLALHDPLTGLPNRRYFTIVLGEEFRKSVLDRSPISLIMVDIDNFKGLNDAFGHPTGDHCLREVGRVLKEFLHKPSDFPGRLGGDEFAVILGGTDVAESQDRAREMLQAISRLKFDSGESMHLTVSLGVATLTPDEVDRDERLVHEADMALYQAKRMGRNRVIHSRDLAD